MKKILFILPMLLFFASCKCKKEATSPATNITTSTMKTTSKIPLVTNCPTDGKRSTEIFRNMALDIKTDEFGSIYYNKIENSETSVILFKYNRNIPKGLQDGNYSEEVIFEINNSDKTIILKDADLQQTKMLFGRFCYCKGAAGNFKIEQGELNLKQKNGEIQFELDFKVTRVPQIITTISETIK